MEWAQLLRSLLEYYGSVDGYGRVLLDLLWLTLSSSAVLHRFSVTAAGRKRRGHAGRQTVMERSVKRRPAQPVIREAEASKDRQCTMTCGSQLSGKTPARLRKTTIQPKPAIISCALTSCSSAMRGFLAATVVMSRIRMPKMNSATLSMATPMGREGEVPVPESASRTPAPATPQNCIRGKNCGYAYAVAEIDFIRAADSDDLMGLRDAFGFVLVPSERYGEASSALTAKGLDPSSFLVPAQTPEGECAYGSIATARTTGALVLSDSENVGRLCRLYEIPCLALSDWRRRAHPC